MDKFIDTKVIDLYRFIDRVQHKFILNIPLDNEEEYILNDLANQLIDSRSVFAIEKKSNSKK